MGCKLHDEKGDQYTVMKDLKFGQFAVIAESSNSYYTGAIVTPYESGGVKLFLCLSGEPGKVFHTDNSFPVRILQPGELLEIV